MRTQEREGRRDHDGEKSVTVPAKEILGDQSESHGDNQEDLRNTLDKKAAAKPKDLRKHLNDKRGGRSEEHRRPQNSDSESETNGGRGRTKDRKRRRSPSKSPVRDRHSPSKDKQPTEGRLAAKSPFSSNIQKDPVKRVKCGNLSYDGNFDPRGHLAAYEGFLGIEVNSDATWCKNFPTTQQGTTTTWFRNLPAGCIHSFDELATSFENHFVASQRAYKTVMNLLQLKQRKNESLCEYLTRFGRVYN